MRLISSFLSQILRRWPVPFFAKAIYGVLATLQRDRSLEIDGARVLPNLREGRVIVSSDGPTLKILALCAPRERRRAIERFPLEAGPRPRYHYIFGPVK